MTQLETSTPPEVSAPGHVNVSSMVLAQAKERPDAVAVIDARTGSRVNFTELARQIEAIAAGLREHGICDGAKAILAVKPGLDFVALVFALFRAGAVPVVVDPGMGKRNLLACIAEAEAEALVGIPIAHALSLRFRGAFKTVRTRVTVGRRWLWGGATLTQLKQIDKPCPEPTTRAHDTAAILFTSGATGVPKGVVYTHDILVAQTEMIRDAYNIEPGEVDVACFALFALFSVAMGVTVVLPDMDFSKPAKADPAKIVGAIRQHKATMSFASPAVWRKVGPHLMDNELRLETLRRILIAGAAVPYATLAQLKPAIAEDGDIHTPYGATESLPFSTISATDVLAETRYDTQAGKGVCVGKPMNGVQAKVIKITEGPIADIKDVHELPAGEVGEIIVSSRPTTREYYNRPEATAAAKIRSDNTWHRMGDTGWFDEKGRLWYCGRVSHTVWTEHGPLYPEQVEGVFNNHNAVSRSALVGVGDKGTQRPVIAIELHGSRIPEEDLRQRIATELLAMAKASDVTEHIETVLFHPGLPVDVRHNAKIDREALAAWARGQFQG
jgi:olefin beta-lactone synthetase